MSAADRSSTVFLLEEYWCGEYKLLGCYATEQAALDHAADPNFLKEYGRTDIFLREVGVRQVKQLRPIFERHIPLPRDKGQP